MNRKRNERENLRTAETELRAARVHHWNERRARTGHLMLGFRTSAGEPRLLTLSASNDSNVRHIIRQQVRRMVTP
jgi:hypothetical protein